eukprot:2671560-Pyramimonas_sp.AAC.1
MTFSPSCKFRNEVRPGDHSRGGASSSRYLATRERHQGKSHPRNHSHRKSRMACVRCLSWLKNRLRHAYRRSRIGLRSQRPETTARGLAFKGPVCTSCCTANASTRTSAFKISRAVHNITDHEARGFPLRFPTDRNARHELQL